jgi:PBP1b-binding outer membrane lipoprotein LpoB
MKKVIGLLALGLAAVAGCGGGHSYEQDRPPTDALVEGNTGIQAKDVGSATDHMANDLLALRDLNTADRKWTIVITDPINKTSDQTFSHYNVFSDRLKPLLLSKSNGRVALIENKSQFHDVQNQELEKPADNMGQGGGGTGNPAGIQPDYALTITIDEMPNRASSYFLITASLTNLQTRQVVWSNYPPYEIQTAR